MQPSPPDLRVSLIDPLSGVIGRAPEGPPLDQRATVSSASDRQRGWLYVIAGLVGFAAATTLLIEKIALLNDPTYVPSCSFNPILSCGSIMQSEQSEAFGFPNPIIGVAGFAIVVTVGMALLAGASFRPWFWRGLALGTLGGAVFVHWLIFQSLYRIGALCPYCMVVWVVTIPIFWYTTLHSFRRRRALLAGKLATYHGVVLTVWYLAIAGLIAQRFWDYWQSLLT